MYSSVQGSGGAGGNMPPPGWNAGPSPGNYNPPNLARGAPSSRSAPSPQSGYPMPGPRPPAPQYQPFPTHHGYYPPPNSMMQHPHSNPQRSRPMLSISSNQQHQQRSAPMSAISAASNRLDFHPSAPMSAFPANSHRPDLLPPTPMSGFPANSNRPDLHMLSSAPLNNYPDLDRPSLSASSFQHSGPPPQAMSRSMAMGPLSPPPTPRQEPTRLPPQDTHWSDNLPSRERRPTYGDILIKTRRPQDDMPRTPQRFPTSMLPTPSKTNDTRSISCFTCSPH
ncbi:hypothetical protein BC829DRAFT_154852 [Chytridium lagenaria]|nr:hypothetical protein BC829DRAFT_154852 [Chytridium lagenaria]